MSRELSTMNPGPGALVVDVQQCLDANRSLNGRLCTLLRTGIENKSLEDLRHKLNHCRYVIDHVFSMVSAIGPGLSEYSIKELSPMLESCKTDQNYVSEHVLQIEKLPAFAVVLDTIPGDKKICIGSSEHIYPFLTEGPRAKSEEWKGVVTSGKPLDQRQYTQRIRETNGPPPNAPTGPKLIVSKGALTTSGTPKATSMCSAAASSLYVPQSSLLPPCSSLFPTNKMSANNRQYPTNLSHTKSMPLTQVQLPPFVDLTPTHRLGRSDLRPVSPDRSQTPCNTKEEAQAKEQKQEVQYKIDAILATSKSENKVKDDGAAEHGQADTDSISVKDNSDTQAGKPVTQTTDETSHAESSPAPSSPSSTATYHHVLARMYELGRTMGATEDFAVLKQRLRDLHDRAYGEAKKQGLGGTSSAEEALELSVIDSQVFALAELANVDLSAAPPSQGLQRRHQQRHVNRWLRDKQRRNGRKKKTKAIGEHQQFINEDVISMAKESLKYNEINEDGSSSQASSQSDDDSDGDAENTISLGAAENLNIELSKEAIRKAHRRVTERLCRVRRSFMTAFKRCHDDLMDSLRATNPDSNAGRSADCIAKCMEEHVLIEARLEGVFKRAGLDLPDYTDTAVNLVGLESRPDLPSVKRCRVEAVAEHPREDPEEIDAGDGAPTPLCWNNEVGRAISIDESENEMEDHMRIESLENHALQLLRSLESDMDIDPTSTVSPELDRPNKRRRRAEDFF